jgi:hypothetical protein
LSAARRRHRVVTRPKVRSQQWRQRGAIAMMALLMGAAAAGVRQVRLEAPSWGALARKLEPQAVPVVEGAPAGWEEPFLKAVSGVEGGASAKAAGLAEAYPFIKTVKADRQWLAKRLRFRVELRRAVARAGRQCLADDGVVFDGPESLYPGPYPSLELAQAPKESLSALAGLVAELGARLSRARFDPSRQAWELELSDGTRVSWGTLEWTKEKLARLSQVLEDSRQREPGAAGFAVDLRYFEDGKVLVKNMAGRPVPALAGPR